MLCSVHTFRLKVKGVLWFTLKNPVCTATGRHLSYRITQDHTCHPTHVKLTRPALTPASKLVLDLPTYLGYPAVRRPGTEPKSIHTYECSLTELGIGSM